MARAGRGGGPVRLPPHAPGMRIGLYGGSFNPAHAGHRHVALTALRRLVLDRVWWILGPGNPLKGRAGLPSSAERALLAREVAAHPRMQVTEFEAAIEARFTVETIRFLKRRCPGVRFVLILGADSFATLHRWREWREIAALVPIAVVDRPGWTLRAQRGRAAATLSRARIRPGADRLVPHARPPAWTFVGGPRSNISSTMLRDALPRQRPRH